MIGAAGVEDVGVGGSSPLEAAGVAPVAPFLFAGFYNQYQCCSKWNESTQHYLSVFGGFLLGIWLVPL